MRIGKMELPQIYYFVSELGAVEEIFTSTEELNKRIECLRKSNYLLKSNSFYGDITVEGNTLKYKSYQVIPVSKDVDDAYSLSKNMTQLKKQFKEDLKSFKGVRLATFEGGFLRSVSKKTTTKKLVLVEEYESLPLDESGIVDSIFPSNNENDILQRYNMLPDAKFLFLKEYYATDYQANTTVYTIKRYRVLDRAVILSEMDAKTTKVQCDYTAREKYGIADSSSIKFIKIPSFNEYPIFYKEDRQYLNPHELFEIYRHRKTDIKLLKALLDDKYTDLKPKLEDEDSMRTISDKEDDLTRREKVALRKKRLRGDIFIYESLSSKENKSFEDMKQLETEKTFLERSISSLLSILIYKNPKSKEVNYSIVRHIGAILKRRDVELNEYTEEYMDSLVKNVEEGIRLGYLPKETNFNFIKF